MRLASYCFAASTADNGVAFYLKAVKYMLDSSSGLLAACGLLDWLEPADYGAARCSAKSSPAGFHVGMKKD